VNPVYYEAETMVKSFNAPAPGSYGNLPTAVKGYEREPVGLRSPIKTY
jgi:hypothetical protein